jgi:hypothetical protein
MPLRIRLRQVAHIAGDADHRMSYRSDRWKCNAVRITPVTGPHSFGKQRIEWLMDGSERRWKSWTTFRKALAKARGVKL